jgi:serine/threonine-protein kinase
VRSSSERTRAGGRYVLGDLLGRGGMAEVFAGFSIGDHGFQKPVAIKRLLPELASDHVYVERLIGEAKLLVGMQHGNIVSVLDLARDGDDVFLVMEFVDGPTLRQLLKARGARGLSLGTATYIVQMAATGLELAHSRGIIHADISPSNLLLTTSGEVRVADFGIARREGGGHGVVEGKWAYMAPEQARGEPLAPRSDVFALGVVLYELITGKHPLGRQITHEERDSAPLRVTPPRVVKPSIPPGLDAICMRALAHDPHDRYARMQQLIDALVEERFANQYREGASDLAQTIREVSPRAAAVVQPRTLVTDRGVTILTRSLIEHTPSSSRFACGTPPPFPLPLPAMESGGEKRGWAIAILGIAVVIGVIAALVIQLTPTQIPAPAVTSVDEPPPALPPASRPEPEVTPVIEPPVVDEPADTPQPVRRPVKRKRIEPAKKAPPGILRVGSPAFAWVTVAGQTKEHTDEIALSPGKHAVRVKNDATGEVKTFTVVIESAKVHRLIIREWEDE